MIRLCCIILIPFPFNDCVIFWNVLHQQRKLFRVERCRADYYIFLSCFFVLHKSQISWNSPLMCQYNGSYFYIFKCVCVAVMDLKKTKFHFCFCAVQKLLFKVCVRVCVLVELTEVCVCVCVFTDFYSEVKCWLCWSCFLKPRADASVDQ